MRLRMKKFIYALFATLLILSFAGSAYALTPLPQISMRLKSTGSHVLALQNNLAELGLYEDDADGSYGVQTVLAVKRLQEKLGLPADGACGPLTIQTFNAYISLAAATSSSVQNTQQQEASPLAGKKIGIDAGHQKTPDLTLEPIAPGSSRMKQKMSAGAVGVKTKIPEYETTLIIAKKLQAQLEEAGAIVYMLRTEDDVRLSNVERAKAMNLAGVDCWIRIHCDSNSDPAANGVHVLTPSSTSSPTIAQESLRLAKRMLKGVCGATGAKELSVVTKSDQTGFNWSERPVVTVELGYLSNPTEDVRLNRAYYQDACAKGMFDALSLYFSEA